MIFPVSGHIPVLSPSPLLDSESSHIEARDSEENAPEANDPQRSLAVTSNEASSVLLSVINVPAWLSSTQHIA